MSQEKYIGMNVHQATISGCRDECSGQAVYEKRAGNQGRHDSGVYSRTPWNSGIDLRRGDFGYLVTRSAEVPCQPIQVWLLRRNGANGTPQSLFRRAYPVALPIRIAARPMNRIKPIHRGSQYKCGRRNTIRPNQTKINRAKLPSSTNSPKISCKIVRKQFMRSPPSLCLPQALWDLASD